MQNQANAIRATRWPRLAAIFEGSNVTEVVVRGQPSRKESASFAARLPLDMLPRCLEVIMPWAGAAPGQGIDPGGGDGAFHGRWRNGPAPGTAGRGPGPLAVAGGREAIVAVIQVLFTPATTLVSQLANAHREGRLEEKLTHCAKPKLLTVDELAHPSAFDAAYLFFQLVSRRYERGAMLVTSHRPVGAWGSVFGDPVGATAILDRRLHHSDIITIR